MTYRNQVFSPYTGEKKPKVLPKIKVFERGEDALTFFKKHLESPSVSIQRPWLGTADATNHIKRIQLQVQEDWELLRELLSERELHHVVQAYQYSDGLLKTWQYINTLEVEESEGGILGKAHGLRDDLLSLAGVAFRGKEAPLQEINRIKAQTHPSNSLYREIHQDLIDTIVLFEKNKFTKSRHVLYPDDLLKEASQLVEQLPLLAPSADSVKKQETMTPLGHRAFSILLAAYHRISAAGYLVHYPPNEARVLYPALSSLKRKKPTSKDTPTETP